jgi:hypothetical protein
MLLVGTVYGENSVMRFVIINVVRLEMPEELARVIFEAIMN